ncbi:MFS general substrate transporter [Cristinia sonorae]|uniref:MFS general substrate transporter n=1 Tax=Cristinia sonorae TaxID=1940300 RepID=A0A8K0UT11_9AGAR|nr:MFS general substrate transporter [Cristinia sonorae]
MNGHNLNLVMVDDHGSLGCESSTVSKSAASHMSSSRRLPNHPGQQGETEEKLDPFEVQFDPDDPENPHNWSRRKRWYLTGLSGLLVLNATFASSVPSEIVGPLEHEFGFSIEVGALLISLFVAGYCVGPLLWGPLSEQYGRRIIGIISFTIYTGSQVGCALSPNSASLLIFRFLGGTFAASPMTNSGAIISDIWDADTRGTAMALFTLAPFAGPSLGPTVGGFMVTAGVSWRWVFWLLAMFAGACGILLTLTQPETYSPVILVRKAKRLRKETGDDRWWAPLERQQVGLRQHLEHILGRPFEMLFMEPMLVAINLYMSFVYGCMYLLFEAYPIVFSVGHGLNPGKSGLMFMPIFVGGTAACLVYMLYWNPIYKRLVKQYAPDPVPPEFRLDICAWAAPGFALSFFWFGWTSFPSISIWAPMMSGLVIGFTIIWIFLGLLNYTIDAYLFAAASALAANTVLRSIFGAGFPLFANQMFDKLNPRWASTLLGCIALLMMPLPLVLKRYGPFLQRKSRFTPKRTVNGTRSEEGSQGVMDGEVEVKRDSQGTRV